MIRCQVHNNIAMRLQLYANTRSHVSSSIGTFSKQHDDPQLQQEVKSIQVTVVNQVPPKNPRNEDGIPLVSPSLLPTTTAADGIVSLADDVSAMSIDDRSRTNGEPSASPNLPCSPNTLFSIPQPDSAPFRSPFSESFDIPEECGYCTYEMATVRLWPCGHFLCDDCSTVGACPKCKEPVLKQRPIAGLA
jgi:hypothetical protein